MLIIIYIASIAIRIMSDTRDEEQEQRWREKQDRAVLQDTQDLVECSKITLGYIIYRGCYSNLALVN